MKLDDFIYLYPVCNEIIKEYETWRENGLSPKQAAECVFSSYEEELEDEDDRLVVLTSIALGMAWRRELTKALLKEAQQSLSFLDSTAVCDVSGALLGQNKDFFPVYSRRSKREKYHPGWKIGDIFTHQFQGATAHEIGLHGFCAVFQKVGEYVDKRGAYSHLMLCTVTSSFDQSRLNSVFTENGWLITGLGHRYLACIKISGKKSEKQYGLDYRGNMEIRWIPNDIKPEQAETAFPLFSFADREDSSCPDYESSICRLYNWWGVHKEKRSYQKDDKLFYTLKRTERTGDGLSENN